MIFGCYYRTSIEYVKYSKNSYGRQYNQQQKQEPILW